MACYREAVFISFGFRRLSFFFVQKYDQFFVYWQTSASHTQSLLAMVASV